jgi:hypothetical protein
MEQERKNKAFIINYFNDISGVDKTRELLEHYIEDEDLIGHIIFFEAAFPKYELFIDEMTAETNRVVLTARIEGKHLGALGDIPATGREANFFFVIRYEIENEKIISHWMLADQMRLMEQLGVVSAATPH